MSRPESAKDRIKQELLRQLGDVGYGAITVTGLAESLGMSRQNLYKHYTSKEQIFFDITEERLEAYFDVFEQFYSDRSTEKWGAVIRNLLAVIESNRELLGHILEGQTEPAVFASLKAAIARALGHVARVNGIVISDRAFFDILALHIAGSSYHITRAWILGGADVPAAKLALVLGDLFNDSIVTKLKACDQSAQG